MSSKMGCTVFQQCILPNTALTRPEPISTNIFSLNFGFRFWPKKHNFTDNVSSFSVSVSLTNMLKYKKSCPNVVLCCSGQIKCVLGYRGKPSHDERISTVEPTSWSVCFSTISCRYLNNASRLCNNELTVWTTEHANYKRQCLALHHTIFTLLV